MSLITNALDNVFGINSDINVEEKRNLDLTTPSYNSFTQYQYFNWVNKLKSVNEDRISPLVNAHKILAENISRIPIVIKKDGEVVKNHPLYSILRFKPNNYSNISTLKSAVEYDRNKYGNGFVKINRNRASGLITGLEYIVSDKNTKCIKKGNNIYYYFSNGSGEKVVNGNDLLHLRQPLLEKGGILGITPLTALHTSIEITAKGINAIDGFYDNNLMSPLVISSKTNANTGSKRTKEAAQEAAEENGGYMNSGKMIVLPPNVDITPLTISLIDAQVIETLKFTRDEIAALFGIPNYMMNNSDSEQDIEQQSLSFRNFTIAPIISIYKAEFESKLLTTKELIEGYSIEFDTDVLVDSDLKTKATAYTLLTKNALMTKNEGIEKLGNKKIEGGAGDKHYLQMQDVAIEDVVKNNTSKENDQ